MSDCLVALSTTITRLINERDALQARAERLEKALKNSASALDCAISFLEDDCDFGIQDLKPSAIWLPKIQATRQEAKAVLEEGK